MTPKRPSAVVLRDIALEIRALCLGAQAATAPKVCELHGEVIAWLKAQADIQYRSDKRVRKHP